jgi:hypothetical protein
VSEAAGKGQAVDPMMPTPQAPLMVNGSASAIAPAAEPVAPAPAEFGRLISVNRDGSDGASHALTGSEVAVGSGLEATLSFEDHYLSQVHFRIRHDSGRARLILVDRLNGVFRRLRGEITEERTAPPLVQHGVALFGSPNRAPWGRLSVLLASGGVRDVRFLDGDEFVVGREEGNMIFSDDEFLSRRHMAFRRKAGRLVVSDLGSSNGTFVRLTEDTVLEPGDCLRAGDQMFRFEAQS